MKIVGKVISCLLAYCVLIVTRRTLVTLVVS